VIAQTQAGPRVPTSAVSSFPKGLDGQTRWGDRGCPVPLAEQQPELVLLEYGNHVEPVLQAETQEGDLQVGGIRHDSIEEPRVILQDA